ncbi:hypothetical protein [Thermofilum pendens]
MGAKWVLLGFGLTDALIRAWIDYYTHAGELYTLFELPEDEAEQIFNSMKQGCSDDEDTLPCLILDDLDLLAELTIYKLPLGFLAATWRNLAFAKRGLREALLSPLLYLATKTKLARKKRKSPT